MNFLFVCTGNICRSPMAAGLMEHLAPAPLRPGIKTASAGTNALVGYKASENAIKVMQSMGIDISSHRVRQVDGPMIAEADMVLVMEPFQRRLIQDQFQGSERKIKLLAAFHPSGRIKSIEDPYGGSLFAYQACVQVMSACLQQLLAEIPVGRELTIRQQIMALLTAGPLSLHHLALELDLTEKELLPHLQHVKRSVSCKGGKLMVRPARCRNCGFRFGKAGSFKRPGRCPQCRQSRIEGPWLELKAPSRLTRR